VGPSDDTLQRVLPFVVEHVGHDAVAMCSQTCTAWQLELEARGFCRKTIRLCSLLVLDGDVEYLAEKALQRLSASTGEAERASYLDTNAFLQRWLGSEDLSLHQWVQAASQEPDASFLSRGAASTAEILGLPLVHWVGKPEVRYPGFATLTGHGKVQSVAYSADGNWIVSGSHDKRVRIWDAATGIEVSAFIRVRGGC
jgi:hypothetical protein